MREILFRGKTFDGEWEEGSLHIEYGETTADGKRSLDYRILGMRGECRYVDPNTIGQYTGLTDKNSKKIFEGDIFKFPDEVWESYYTSCGTEYNSWETENNGVVGYCEDYAGYDFVQYKHDENSVYADLHEDHTIQFADFVRELEVIGNIHDNPDLLEVDGGYFEVGKSFMTNGDRIRSMSDEELAEFLNRVKRPCDNCQLAVVAGACTETLCDDAMENWLKQPAEAET